jgi:hypothetical protein
MPAIITEFIESRSFTVGKQSVRERIYKVAGTDDEEEVEALLLGTAPAAYLGLALDSVNADPEGGGIWKGYARYIQPEDEDEYTFDTSGGTQKITQSLFTVNSYGIGGTTPPDFQGAIGVSEDKVEGVDIVIPAFAFTETHKIDNAFILAGYKNTLRNLTGCVNGFPFKGHAPGECIFMGATGSKRGLEDKWSINYRFGASPNQTGLSVGDITDIEKDGWDYLWVRYADFADMSAFCLVKRPIAVKVERVYPRANFAALLIGS